MKKHILFIALAITALPLWAQSEQQIESILSKMTLDEKIAIIHAQSKFSSPGVPRLGIPGLWCSDGPHGVRAEVLWDEWDQAGWTSDSCVAFPALTCLAATWNPAMSRLYGENLAEGYATAQEVFAGWMASPTHKALILDDDYTACGFALHVNGDGVHDYYWAQEFGYVD